ncbi:MAG: helix-turn-helix domain-containing protein [Ornithinimicrobium sp.]|uniref:helix-turn-helix domain-containing protein n=1 Tax=Ornithinimicrobium sp. TaxID=1977084 RepID=UPI0026DF267C|nr:helix-turn-helix domain-containing protein [Ornithinimicrobium sp.]MDO5740932.1 helix-turn-helix domain-containing protein [Ornithinimicrobium sp.]
MTSAQGRVLPFRPADRLDGTQAPGDLGTLDPVALGRRLRHHRREAGLTLAGLGAKVGLSPSALSLIENGRREARVSLLAPLAQALGIEVAAIVGGGAPNRRLALEVRWERAQRAGGFESLGIPPVRVGPSLPDDALEALVGLYETVVGLQQHRAATPEFARLANAELRGLMRTADNYFPQIEERAAELVRVVDHTQGPVTREEVNRIARHVGFSIVPVSDLPASTRTVTDLEHRRIYVPMRGDHDPRSTALQALGHVVLQHETPRDYAEFLAQRVEINYFAAAVLLPESSAVPFLRRAKEARDIALEDLRDAYSVSYETAAHRFCNLATHHLGLSVHFMRTSADGVIYKGYENDGVRFPMDPTGAIEGARVCRAWTARVVFEQPLGEVYAQYTDTGRGTFWCTAVAEQTPNGLFSVSVGVPFDQVRWMRGRDTTARRVSRCPDPRCCTRPPAELAHEWEGRVWPSARAHSHLLAVMPPGVFPGVDDTEVLQFVSRHAQSLDS